jgi:tetratricopeptide (TPR) repeat protein
LRPSISRYLAPRTFGTPRVLHLCRPSPPDDRSSAGSLSATVIQSRIGLSHRAEKRKRFSIRNNYGSRRFAILAAALHLHALRPVALLAILILLLASPGSLHADRQSGAGGSPSAAPGLTQAKSLLDSGKVADAERATRAFLQFHPDSAEGHFLLGLVLFREIQARGADLSTRSYHASGDEASFRAEKAKESLAEFTEGARHATPSAFDLKIVAFDYIMFSDYNDADKWLTRAAGMDPTDADIWYNLARTKYSENRFAEAIEGFQKCLALDPKNEKAENNLGLTLQGLGRTDEAVAAYKQAIAWQADSARKDNEPYLNLGSLFLDQDQPKEALKYLLRANSIPPDDAKIHERLGKAYSHLDQLPQAQAELEKAVALAPNVGSLHFMLGQVYRREGQIEKAKAELQRADELNGTHSSDAAPH